VTEIWSSGGGMQSVAIGELIYQGVLPKPDLAVIVDTERERSTTWEYLDKYTRPRLKEIGLEVHRVPKSRYAKVDLYGGKDGDTLLIPAFTNQSGEVGKLPTLCSTEWKLRVLQRWATKEHGVKKANLWMGMSTDELHRAKPGSGKWLKRYPLIELKMNRGDCVALVLRAGLPIPARSSCWMCPNHREDEWREEKERQPQDFMRAVKFEEYIRKMDQNVWLHSECKPLDQVDFDSRNEVMFGSCDSGMCFV